MANDTQKNKESTPRPSSTDEKVRAFKEAREMANARTQQLMPSLGSHLFVIALGLLVIAIWAGKFALRGCSPAKPSTEPTFTQP